MNYYIEALKKYAVFSGRARRAEFGWFTLVSFGISIVLAIVDNVVGLAPDGAGFSTGLLGALYALGTLVPSIAVLVRRIHDTGRSGWFALLLLIPCVGIFVWLFFAFTAGNSGANEYGPDPKAAA
ncbi:MULTISPECIES: DUF805 domain-containing protein [unclassified Nocardioides]|uniref:DUF805 domain-containing protein n=1 Tax=unclassified Nocardioides TaxID=2615069 RepID=UPI0007004C3C|nr:MULTISPECIES: DUF805 domain-containing protein [unclassified Nocardioides]KRA38107.1 hypothetical protein ASD81_05450 [Nocardioides sp. Root614]KRA92067.1 hypothetical protein ASD84_05715 [Nocardioides sp. Root682]